MCGPWDRGINGLDSLDLFLDIDERIEQAIDEDLMFSDPDEFEEFDEGDY